MKGKTMLEINSIGFPILPIKLYEGNDVTVNSKDLLAWKRTMERMIGALRKRLADPVEMVAEALYRSRPKVPGPPRPSLPKGALDAYRERARLFLSDGKPKQTKPPPPKAAKEEDT